MKKLIYNVIGYPKSYSYRNNKIYINFNVSEYKLKKFVSLIIKKILPPSPLPPPPPIFCADVFFVVDPPPYESNITIPFIEKFSNLLFIKFY